MPLEPVFVLPDLSFQDVFRKPTKASKWIERTGDDIRDQSQTVWHSVSEWMQPWVDDPRVPKRYLGAYGVVLFVCLVFLPVWFHVRITHVFWFAVAIGLIVFHAYTTTSREGDLFGNVERVWKMLPSKTNQPGTQAYPFLYVDANLIVALGQCLDLYAIHAPGFEQSLYHTNELLRLRAEAERGVQDKHAHLAETKRTFQRAYFHFHSMQHGLSGWPQLRTKWVQSLATLHLLWWQQVRHVEQALFGKKQRWVVDPHVEADRLHDVVCTA